MSLHPAFRLTPRLWRLLFWPCLIAVLVLALMPPTQPTPTTGWDKANHVLAFLVLGWLGRRAYGRQRTAVLLGLVGYGVLIELLQGMTTYRDADPADVLADSIGLLAALALDWLLARAGRLGAGASRG
ncbi:VanZ family protein [Cupriavidus sp. WKF15]|uniref:VanZ family protein n=1 Tax=Cupriavidus sp. WKF15 TaxID=3032282 RepID=UPI0023E1EB84|nr:VanZ family protein [Cupriavidus sp. WKF15]WER44495.1 VanZ family protein [Cupriavidus sp. WKF15]